jgi:hypothetical protein
MVRNKQGLIAPAEFWNLTQEQLADICNGCGPKGWGWIVPDRFRLIGVSFRLACDIHDYCYYSGVSKDIADKMFLENMLTLSQSAYFGCKPIAEHFAFIYYLAVKNGGAGAYNRAKNKGRTK